MDQITFSMAQINLMAEIAKQAPYDIAGKLLSVLQQGQKQEPFRATADAGA